MTTVPLPTPSPEAFMTQPPEPDEAETDRQAHLHAYDGGWAEPGPLESIAESLRTITKIAVQVQEESEDETEADRLREAYADLEAKHDTLYALLEEIEAIIKPSVGKLAISVREAITRWRAPEVPVEPPVALGHPAHDAGIEMWRTYARGVQGVGEGTAIDGMNRSQIRSLLGIEQPGAEA